MKTITNHLLVVMLAALMAMTFSACGDDNDELNAGNTELIGKWEFTDGDWGYQFSTGGVGYGVEYTASADYTAMWSFSWSYKNNILTMVDEDGDAEVLVIDYIDNQIMKFHWQDEPNHKKTLYKVNEFSWK